VGISRREFVAASLAAPAAVGAPSTTLPQRVLGRTGARVSILAMAGGSRFLRFKEEEKGIEALNRAFDLGITYMDTAFGYGSGESERRVGMVMKTRRKEIFLATKLNVRKADDARRMLEGSLKRLQTDRVDLLHIHGLGDAQDLAAIEAPDGVLKVLYEARDQKITRFIGVTSHEDPTVLKTALERHDFDCTQMALNAAFMAMKSGPGGNMAPDPASPPSFESIALPVALKKKMGVIAMKVFGQDHLIGKAPAEQLFRYSLSLPVSLAVIGMPKMEHIEENVKMAREFRPMNKAEMRKLASGLAPERAAMERFFRDHLDG
jgi:uncharacterized protein